MNSITLPAKTENLPRALGFVEEQLEAGGAPMRAVIQLQVAVEEIFVNVANYAYTPGAGDVTLSVETGGAPPVARITFEDAGRPFDPLAHEDPDTTLAAAEREIGGLGILMVKKSMDELLYDRRDGKNILTLVKLLS